MCKKGKALEPFYTTHMKNGFLTVSVFRVGNSLYLYRALRRGFPTRLIIGFHEAFREVFVDDDLLRFYDRRELFSGLVSASDDLVEITALV